MHTAALLAPDERVESLGARTESPADEVLPGIARDPAGKPLIGLGADQLFAFGHLIRSTEQLILDLFSRGLLSGTTHTCLGQEICQMSVVRALRDPDDFIVSNHRNHGHFLTYSGRFLGLVAEIMGRSAGVCGGYGGSQHLAYRNFHSNGVQAGMTAIGSGLALERRMRGSTGIVAVMVGDGTTGEGLLYESMNLASVWKAPVLFVVENNGIAQTTNTDTTVSGSIEARGAAFGLATWRLDDADAGFCRRVDDIVAELRGLGRPGMLVIDTRRMGPHSKGDDLRSESERMEIARRDPLTAIGGRLAPAERTRIEAQNAAFIKAIEAAALLSTEANFDEPPLHAFRPAVTGNVPEQPARAANVRGALNAALSALLAADDSVILLGEDLHEPYGGAFKVTAGLTSAFPGRVISTPISEAGITGAGIGLAMAGRRPIVEIMFADFLTLCMDQIYNHAVKFPGMFPEAAVPLVIRTPCGGRRGYGPTHSQSLENLFVSVPGLTVVFGSHRHNVGQLLVNAVQRWPNPTLFLEHKLLYAESQDAGDYTPIDASGEATAAAALFPTLRSGDAAPDVTLVAFGGMLPLVETAAERLRAEEELAVEIVAPALLAPLPRASLIGHLSKRKRVVVVEESHHEFGVSAEILAALAEAGFRGTVLRMGMPGVPIAAARSLERDQLPGVASIVSGVLGLF